MKACLDEISVRGIDDWIQASEVQSIAMEFGGADTVEKRRDLSLEIIRTLLREGLVEIGMVYAHEGFVPWLSGVDESMQRIIREWSALPKGPNIGDICWLNLTQKGEAAARALASR